ncbi:alpha/beta hydrolase [Cypionkella sp.]|uniref:alpha/beta fold hydrolase n=1 Tax=Cypionkella sp. TaxID=2811411 RepID=UPI002ABB9CA4|nr:alpha/beta hydrolase [Cypionkella sp.]MDZ4392059.1 alpha/beta hydrolase [Cypionkella sp.]
MNANIRKGTFVVAHGAWTGAWSWQRVVDRLQAQGHLVIVPTLTGLGERSHLAGPDVNLDTHIADIVNEIVWKDLRGIVLVGHSYGGIVAMGVAEQLADRIDSFVFIEALVPANGQSFADLAPGWELDGPLTDAPPSAPGDYKTEADRLWVDSKATPQPTATITQKLSITDAFERIAEKTFIVAKDVGFEHTAHRFRADPTWSVREIASGHDVPIDAPGELAAMLADAIPT